MPIPYMGSKAKSASRIANVIEAHCKDAPKVIAEPFCGGFAIGEEFLKRGYEVYSNDKNQYVVALLDAVLHGRLDEKKCLEWVSREKFKDIIANPGNYDTWYVGYVGIIWSFGNNNKGYLFGPENERKKRSLFELVVNGTADGFVTDNFPKKYIEGIVRQSDWHKRRMALKKVLGTMKLREDLQSLESLERLESLESLESLENNVTFTAGSYEKMDIPDNAIIYCDPPYAGTAEYAEGNFDHEKFFEWARKKSKTHKVFISEYHAPVDFETVYIFPQKSSLAGGGQSHDDQPNECLYVYNPSKVKTEYEKN